MKKTFVTLGIILALVFGVGSWVAGKYNTMKINQNTVEEKWSNVEVQYQRRFDLIPNLVKTAQGVADFERGTLNDVVNARSAWAKAQSSGSRTGQVAAASAFDSAISRLLVTVEAYPVLKATDAFINVQTELTTSENKVAQSRRIYNESVKAHNNYVEIFPNNFFAGMFNIDLEKSFEADAGTEKAPQIDFGTN